MVLRNVDDHRQKVMVSHLIILQSKFSPPWEPQISDKYRFRAITILLYTSIKSRRNSTGMIFVYLHLLLAFLLFFVPFVPLSPFLFCPAVIAKNIVYMALDSSLHSYTYLPIFNGNFFVHLQYQIWCGILRLYLTIPAARSDFLTAVLMMFFWNLASCRLIGRCRHVGITYCLFLWDWSGGACKFI